VLYSECLDKGNMNNYILGIDTSSSLGLCFVASSKDDVLNSKYIDAKSSHAELIFSAIQDVLNSTGIKINDISTVVYTAGPGSFTGLRIAYSAVRGFVMAEAKLKTHGVSSLKALLYNLFSIENYSIKDSSKTPSVFFSLISGSRNELYAYGKDSKGTVILEEQVFGIDDFINLLSKMDGQKTFIGSGALEYKTKLLELKDAQIPESEIAVNGQNINNLHIIKPEGVLSLLDEKSIDDINYLKASYAETNLQKKSKEDALAKS
jgi:tRNA threonylcarbamoyladenosine biosynthesis protein TsaB